MGGDKGSGTTVVQSGTSSQQRQPTAEETRLNQLDVELREATQSRLIGSQQVGLDLVQQLLKGETALPGFLGELPGGIDEATTSGIVNESLNDLDARLAQTGLIDSGVRVEAGARTAGDIRRQVAEFNIGNRLNLLNLALSGQAQVQAPALGVGQSLGQRLTTLGTTTKNFNATSNTQQTGVGGFSFF